jgi:hypothetical protein
MVTPRAPAGDACVTTGLTIKSKQSSAPATTRRDALPAFGLMFAKTRPGY